MQKNDLGCLIKQISDKMKAVADADLKEHGLTFSQVRILAYLHQHDGRATQREIESYLDVAHPTVVGLVSRLEKNGFITCHTDSEDKRNKVVCLTDKAHKVKNIVEDKRQQNQRQLEAGLTEAEKKELERMLKLISNNIES